LLWIAKLPRSFRGCVALATLFTLAREFPLEESPTKYTLISIFVTWVGQLCFFGFLEAIAGFLGGKEAKLGRGGENIKEWKCLGIAALARWGSTAKGGMGRKI
jgi:hypothetical protein